jgi:hypothetical protein
VKKFERRSCQRKERERKKSILLKSFFKASYFFVLLRRFCRNFFVDLSNFLFVDLSNFLFVDTFYCWSIKEKCLKRNCWSLSSMFELIPSFCFCFVLLFGLAFIVAFGTVFYVLHLLVLVRSFFRNEIFPLARTMCH